MTITTESVQHLRIRRVVTVIAAVAAPALLWAIARAAGADLTVDLQNGEPPMRVGLPIVVAFAAQAAVAGWLLLAVLERFVRRPWTWWRIAAITVLLLSFVPVFGVDVTPGARASLAAMHVAVAVVLLGGMRRSSTEVPA